MEKKQDKYSFSLTDLAIEKTKEALIERGSPNSALRVGVKGGLCSGFGYVLEFCDDPPRDKDLVFEFDEIKVFIDKKSIIYLTGTTLDWKNTLMEQGFQFNNPNAKRSCGCNLSFDV